MHHILMIMLSLAGAQDSPDSEAMLSVQATEKLVLDCSTSLEISKIDEIETADEKAARHDADFFKALMQTDKCIDKVTESAAAAGGGAGAAGGGLKGTEKPATTGATGEPLADSESGGAPSRTTTSPAMPGSSGAIPEDIPDGRNDDVVARQLREAAQQETDPAVQKELWNAYRKYIGQKPVE